MRTVGFFAAMIALLAVGCGDGTSGGDGGMDGATGGCDGVADGTACGASMICVGGACVASACGDGYVDEAAGEQCEDGNNVAFDGCEPTTCTFTCTEDGMCDDGASCNGVETCNASTHACDMGTPPAEGTSCSTAMIAMGVCRLEECVPAGCGNGVVDGGEDCDDMNDVEGDGCDNDCTFSCTMDAECSDSDVCTGEETCDLASHTCVAGTAMTCDDGVACTSDECDPVMGCQFPLIDMDMDGHAAESLGACGTDCDDMRDDVNPDQQEQCDAVDHDCDGSDIPPATPFWYLDCDGDGFATMSAPSMQVCDEPAPQPCGGGWTTMAPLSPATTDCNDADADARPGQTMWFTTAATGGGFDYNCVNGEEMRWTSTDADQANCFPIFVIGDPNPRGCLGTDGWTSTTVAPCGTSRSFSDCGDTDPGRGITCGRTTVTRTQECR